MAKVNLKSGLYRGILSEVARDMGVARTTVKKGYDRRTPKFVEAVTRKIAERNRIRREHEKVLRRRRKKN